MSSFIVLTCAKYEFLLKQLQTISADINFCQTQKVPDRAAKYDWILIVNSNEILSEKLLLYIKYIFTDNLIDYYRGYAFFTAHKRITFMPRIFNKKELRLYNKQLIDMNNYVLHKDAGVLLVDSSAPILMR